MLPERFAWGSGFTIGRHAYRDYHNRWTSHRVHPNMTHRLSSAGDSAGYDSSMNGMLQKRNSI